MTHPPQQPGPHGPHGQQAQYGQPYPGGYPAQYQQGPGMPPGGYPPPQPPPHRGKTGVIVGITLTLLLLATAAVAITGFWTPGYFVSDDTSTTQAANASEQPDASAKEQPPKPSVQTQPGAPVPGEDSSAEDVAALRALGKDAAKAINTRDDTLVRQVSCASNGAPDFSEMPKDAHAEMTGEPVVNGDTAQVPFRITLNGSAEEGHLPAQRQNGAWCFG